MRYLAIGISSLVATAVVIGCGMQMDSDSSLDTRGAIVEKNSSYSTNDYNYGEYNRYRRMYPAKYSFVDSRGYGYYAFVHLVIKDTAHVDALKAKAEAALVKARAEARAADARTAVIFKTIKLLESEIARLDAELKLEEAQQGLIMNHTKTLSRIALKGEATKTVFRSVEFFLLLAGTNLSEFRDIRVSAMDAGQFVAQTSYRVVDGRIVRNNTPVEFKGGSLADYLRFLQSHNQNTVVGSSAHGVLLDLFESIKSAGADRLAGLEKTKEARRLKTRKAYKKIEALIAKFE